VSLSPDARRFLPALLLSVLVHALLVWRIPLSLPDREPELPLLQAKLEPLPSRPAPAAPPPRRKPKTQPPAPPAPEQLTTPSADQAVPDSAAAPADVAPVSAVAAAEPEMPPAPPATVINRTPPPLPRHAQLKYAVTLDENGLTVGEARHTLDIVDGRYSVKAVIRTVGLASLFKHVEYTQISQGAVTEWGLQPDYAKEIKDVDHQIQTFEMVFDRTGHTLNFSQGRAVALTDDAQDRLSLLYQLSRMQLAAETLPLAVANGRSLEHYEVQIDQQEEIITPMGKLLTLPLHKIHRPGEEGLDIWLALEYRLLPVKVIRTDRNGKVNGAVEISEIRLAD
jgi:hypothetical protein